MPLQPPQIDPALRNKARQATQVFCEFLLNASSQRVIRSVMEDCSEEFGIQFNLSNIPNAPKEFKNLTVVLNLPINPNTYMGAYRPPIKHQAKISISYGLMSLDVARSAEEKISSEIERELGNAIELVDRFMANSLVHGRPAHEYWIDFVEKNAEKIAQAIHTTFFHEYIHHLDLSSQLRKGHQIYPGKMARCALTYYNLPPEIVAYVQQAFYNIEDAIGNARDPKDKSKIICDSPAKFINTSLRTYIHNKFIDNLYKKHLLAYSDWATDFWVSMVQAC